MFKALLVAILLLFPVSSFAQIYGAAGLGITSSSNVSGIDSSVPDIILEPSLILGYDARLNHRFGISAAAGFSMNKYLEDNDRSYSSLFAGVTPTYYFLTKETFLATTSSKDSHAVSSTQQVSTVSERIKMLDNWLKAVIPKLPQMRRTLDSSQELLSVVRELLSTTSYTTSVKEIVLGELRSQQAGLEALQSLELENILREWKNLVAQLEATEEESDFLPVEEFDIESEQVAEAKSEQPRPLAPLTTLSTSHLRFRNLSGSDFYVLKDRADLNERTIATSLSLPVSFSHQSNSDLYESYSNDQLWLSLRANAYPTEKLQLSGSIDNISSSHPFDSSYTYVDWRVRGAAKYVLGDHDVSAFEVSYGARNYSSPLSTTIDTSLSQRPGPLVLTAESEFSQLTFGLWHQHFFSETFSMGAILSLVLHPELKGYVTALDSIDPRDALASAEDEFNFDHTQVALFANLRFLDTYDAAFDVTYEDRSYGAIAIRNLPTNSRRPIFQEIIARTEEAARTENWITVTGSLSKIFIFENRVASIFSGLGLEAMLSYTTVEASVEDYNYDSFSASLSAIVYF